MEGTSLRLAGTPAQGCELTGASLVEDRMPQGAKLGDMLALWHSGPFPYRFLDGYVINNKGT
jgi:hypothetical protein